MDNYTDILRKSRKTKRLTQAQVAERVAAAMGSNFSLRQYQRIEDGEFPKYKGQIVKEIDKILGTSIHDKIYDKEEGQGKIETNESLSLETIRDLARSNIILSEAHKDLTQSHKELVMRYVKPLEISYANEEEKHREFSSKLWSVFQKMAAAGVPERWPTVSDGELILSRLAAGLVLEMQQ